MNVFEAARRIGDLLDEDGIPYVRTWIAQLPVTPEGRDRLDDLERRFAHR